ncbi:Rad4-domain-containing protein [Bimuria novae-zelandiae CBS 107.79]|uniref:Rad4-domain-containing protein n=1 Tax=Bimuria novae-zelandiae CBS 107.79 TaxID=1447943 RepID=A0A6A5VUZ0_9PLEO|nr:Rad4-domain-containing protein [Bimuria novae-zelandiae CBS 107.79]
MMPPAISRKRLQSESPKPEPPPKRAANARRKEAALETPPTIPRTLSQKKKQLEELIGGDDDSDLSSPESSEDEFEDVPLRNGKQKAQDFDRDDESEEDEWEDALGMKHHTKHNPEAEREPVISGDLAFTLNAPPETNYLDQSRKKRPSKEDKRRRREIHMMHVTYLLYHNALRNRWLCDQEVQKIMLGHLNAGCWKAVNRYWRDAGIADGPSRVVEGGWTDKIARDIGKALWVQSGTKGVEVYDSPQKGTKGKGTKAKAATKAGPSNDKSKKASSDRNARDWGATAERSEPNTPNLSAGDPLPRLLNYLALYWKSKYRITSPSLRKRGYLSPAAVNAEVRAWEEHPSDTDTFGERLENLDAFRELARTCQGSRDAGQQLFTALIRALGIEARMVVSLQPAGFSFQKAEDGKPKDLSNVGKNTTTAQTNGSKSTPNKAGSSKANGGKDDPIDLSDSELSSVISVPSGDEEEAGSKDPENAPQWQDRYYGRILPYPTYWTEAISNLTHTPVAISVIPKITVATPADQRYHLFESTKSNADRCHQVFAYLVAFSSDLTAKDITNRYLHNRRWPGITKGFRMPTEKVPVYDREGHLEGWGPWNFFENALKPYTRLKVHRKPWDEVEDEGDLVPAQAPKPRTLDEGAPETIQGYKNSTKYVLERHLLQHQAIKPGVGPCKHFTTGKGDKEKSEPVYYRKDVVDCRSVESWHKEGRAIKEGEQPLKYVPQKAVTVQRRREIAERERDEGQKMMQGLYSEAQTDWIVPDPIVDGQIPRNAFGNIDVYVPTMVPKGAIHIPLKGTAKICRKLGINYAEACTGFDFKKQRAVPVLTGVVVAVEHEDIVIDAWEAADAERVKKEEGKREALVLGLWRKFMNGLRIVERMSRVHGNTAVEVWQKHKEETNKAKATKSKSQPRPRPQSEWDAFHNYDGDFEGGFVRDEPSAGGGFVPENNDAKDEDQGMAGGFEPPSEDEAQPGGFMLDDKDMPDAAPHSNAPAAAETAYQTPISMHARHQNPTVEPQPHKANGLATQLSGSASSDEVLIPASTRRTRGTTSTRGRARGRAKRLSTSTRKTKSLVDTAADPSLSDPLSDTPASDTLSRSTPAPRAKRPISASRDTPAEPAEGRSVPKRKAARKSEAQVKSHFFAHGSGDETDASPQKGGARGREWGRGRGKWRAV